jgi:uncharacterized repeat protein (TIGR01451 family)
MKGAPINVSVAVCSSAKLTLRWHAVVIQALVALCWLATAGPLRAAPTAGAAIYVAGDVTGVVDVFNQTGSKLTSFDLNFTINDRIASGDVTGDGVAEILIAGDVSGDVCIFDTTGRMIRVFDGNYTIGDGFAVGDIDGNGVSEILIAGCVTGVVDIFDQFGNKIRSFNGNFTAFDAFAVGDIDGNNTAEILIAGDVSGDICIFDGNGNLIRQFDGDYTIGDGFSVDDVMGGAAGEILVAGCVTGVIDIFDQFGNKLNSFNGNFTVNDAFATGDVNNDGKAEILIAGDVSGDICIFNAAGTLLRNFDGDYTISDGFAVEHSSRDTDGDGLLDSWELFGLDADGDGTIDVNLPAMGANPMHKDLYLEFDWVTGQAPSKEAIRLFKQAFARAPIDAGGFSNPDGLPGINLWVDTGNCVDPNAAESGGMAGSCSDGIDNDGDGLIDGADPDCLCGDNFGGGNAIIESTLINCLSNAFYSAKSTNFNALRRNVFRYAISGNPAMGIACGGGQGEIGGNDFIEYNHDAGTIMHEFGHNLDLHHGGNDEANCKPNYISVMNYDHQFSIQRTDGTTNIDYSPPLASGTARGATPLPQLMENNLNENTILDPTDNLNMFAFVNSLGQKVRAPLNQRPNYNANGSTTDSGLTVNLDTSNAANNRPRACSNNVNNSTFNGGFDDWRNIALNFRQFGDSADGAINPVTEPELVLEDLLLLDEAFNTTDLVITGTAAPNPVVTGTRLTYTFVVHNNGPNPARRAQLNDTLPAQVTFLSASAGCVLAGNTVACDLGFILNGTTSVATITVEVSCAVANGVVINNTAVASHDGPELEPGDNSALVPATASNPPPVIMCPANIVQATDPGLCSAVVMFTATATDNCPGVVISCIPPSGTAFPKGNTTVTCTATDSGGATAQCQFNVTVEDREPPRVACRAGTNPSGKNVPVAGKNAKSGENPDGFYQLLAEDNCDPNPKIFIKDSASNFIAGPFSNGDQVKIVQAPGVTPNRSVAAGVLVARIQVKGDALILARDADGNVSDPLPCRTPPPPK